MQQLSEAEEKKRRTEQIEIEDRMKSRIVTMVQDHDRALRGAEEYYSAIQKKLLVDQKMLKVLGFKKSHSPPPMLKNEIDEENKWDNCVTWFRLDLLQEELRNLMKDKQLQKDILAAQQENQRLQACLQEAEEKLLKLQEKLDGYSEAKAKKAVRRKRKT